MADTIQARCPSCGLSIRAAAGLAGRKAKCPKCAGIITIPQSHESAAGAVPDAELPQVAQEPVHAGAKAAAHGRRAAHTDPHASVPAEAADDAAAPSSDHAAQVAQAAHGPNAAHIHRPAGGRGTHRRMAPKPPVSKKKLAILGSIGLVVAAGLGIVIYFVLTTTGQLPDPDAPRLRKPPPVVAYTAPMEREVRQRYDEFITIINASSDPSKIAAFHLPEKREEVIAFYKQVFEKRWLAYENWKPVTVTLSDGDTTAVMEVSFDRITTNRDAPEGSADAKKMEKDQKRTITWKKVDSDWLITDAPAE